MTHHYLDNDDLEIAMATYDLGTAADRDRLGEMVLLLARNLVGALGPGDRDAEDWVAGCALQAIASLPYFDRRRGKAFTFLSEVMRRHVFKSIKRRRHREVAIPWLDEVAVA